MRRAGMLPVGCRAPGECGRERSPATGTAAAGVPRAAGLRGDRGRLRHRRRHRSRLHDSGHQPARRPRPRAAACPARSRPPTTSCWMAPSRSSPGSAPAGPTLFPKHRRHGVNVQVVNDPAGRLLCKGHRECPDRAVCRSTAAISDPRGQAASLSGPGSTARRGPPWNGDPRPAGFRGRSPVWGAGRHRDAAGSSR